MLSEFQDFKNLFSNTYISPVVFSSNEMCWNLSEEVSSFITTYCFSCNT